MSLLNTIKGALGLQRPIKPVSADTPLKLSDAAKRALTQLAPNEGIHLSTVEDPMGHRVLVEPGPVQGPPAPGFAPLPITASDRNLQRMRGLTLDHQHGQWVISLHLDVRARETPNPNSRLYLTDRVLAGDEPVMFHQPSAVPLANLLLGIDGVVRVMLRENTVTVEREAGVPWPSLDGRVDQALRSALLGCHQPVFKEDIAVHVGFAAEVEQVIAEKILPGIHRDGGDLELLGVSDGVVQVRLHGACRSCPSSKITLHHGVERMLKESFPGQITQVVAVD